LGLFQQKLAYFLRKKEGKTQRQVIPGGLAKTFLRRDLGKD